MSNDFETPRPFPEDKEGQINWFENEIQRWHLRTDYVIPESNAPLNGPIVHDAPPATPTKEEIIERLTTELEALRNS
jgi:hypothetical protein